ncbi:MAG: hypothetical protein ACRD27_11705 [Terracidiphilus sp.]
MKLLNMAASSRQFITVISQLGTDVPGAGPAKTPRFINSRILGTWTLAAPQQTEKNMPRGPENTRLPDPHLTLYRTSPLTYCNVTTRLDYTAREFVKRKIREEFWGRGAPIEGPTRGDQPLGGVVLSCRCSHENSFRENSPPDKQFPTILMDTYDILYVSEM